MPLKSEQTDLNGAKCASVDMQPVLLPNSNMKGFSAGWLMHEPQPPAALT